MMYRPPLVMNTPVTLGDVYIPNQLAEPYVMPESHPMSRPFLLDRFDYNVGERGYMADSLPTPWHQNQNYEGRQLQPRLVSN